MSPYPYQVSRPSGMPAAIGLSRSLAVVSMMFRTWMFVRLGAQPTISAARPAAWGEAMEVPLAVAYVELLPIQAEKTLTPGAASSTLGPVLEKQAAISFESVAPTAMTSG